MTFDPEEAIKNQLCFTVRSKMIKAGDRTPKGGTWRRDTLEKMVEISQGMIQRGQMQGITGSEDRIRKFHKMGLKAASFSTHTVRELVLTKTGHLMAEIQPSMLGAGRRLKRFLQDDVVDLDLVPIIKVQYRDPDADVFPENVKAVEAVHLMFDNCPGHIWEDVGVLDFGWPTCIVCGAEDRPPKGVIHPFM